MTQDMSKIKCDHKWRISTTCGHILVIYSFVLGKNVPTFYTFFFLLVILTKVDASNYQNVKPFLSKQ